MMGLNLAMRPNNLSQPCETPTKTMCNLLMRHPGFTQRSASRHAGITEQRHAKWVINRVVELSVTRTSSDTSRKLYTSLDVIHVAVAARLADEAGIPLEAAGYLGKIGADSVLRAWVQAGLHHDLAQHPDPGTIRNNFEEKGFTWYARPNPFGVVDAAEERLQEPNITCVAYGGKPDDDRAHGFAPEVQIGEVVTDMRGPFITIDLAPFCRGLLKPIADDLRHRVVIEQTNVPEAVWQEWETKGGIPAGIARA